MILFRELSLKPTHYRIEVHKAVETFDARSVSKRLRQNVTSGVYIRQRSMERFDPTQPVSFPRAATIVPPLAGLLVASVLAFSSASAPSQYVSWTGLIGFAVERLLTISLCCVFTVSVLCAIVSRRTDLDQRTLFVQTSRAAVWLVPLALLIRTRSAWALVAVSIFAVLLTPLLRGPEFPELDLEDSLLSSLRPDPLPLFAKFSLPISIAAALCGETGAMLFFDGDSAVGAVMVGAATCVWMWRSVAGTYSANPSCQSGSLPMALLAVIFTVAALIPFLHGASGIGLGSSHKYAMRVLPAREPSHRHFARQILDDSSAGASEGNTGIVLWPGKQLHAKLVAPSPIDLASHPTFGRSANPLVIPFDGVYWFYKAPDLRPPKTSRQAHASPDMVDIRSTDRRPLSIDAHDYLGSLINLDCCSRIRVAIRNADRYPDSVSLELILIDTSQPQTASESLGQEMVKSTRPWRIYERPRPIDETLNFLIPVRGRLRHFDGISIIFHLDPSRADAAARIAIDHLVLIPRGL